MPFTWLCLNQTHPNQVTPQLIPQLPSCQTPCKGRNMLSGTEGAPTPLKDSIARLDHIRCKVKPQP